MNYRTQSVDTSPEAEAVLIAGVRAFTPTRRLQIMNRLTGSARRLAWRQFRAQSGFVPVLNEHRVHSARYGYAGTIDLFGVLNSDAALIDAKRTAAVPRSVGPQTAGYEQAIRESLPDAVARCVSGPGNGHINRYALHLTPERWRLVPQKDPNDLRVFLASLTLHNYLEKAA